MTTFKRRAAEAIDTALEWAVMIGVTLGAVFLALLGLALTVFTLALPFIAIGLGLGAAGWAFCLFVPFC